MKFLEGAPDFAVEVRSEIHPNLVTKWKQTAQVELPRIFERKNVKDAILEEQERKIAELYNAWIGD